MIPTLWNATNQTIEGALTVVTTSAGISPDVAYLAPAIVVLGLWLICLYIIEYRRDVFWGLFMIVLGAISAGNALLSSISFNIVSLTTLLIFMGAYEVLITLYVNSERKANKFDPLLGDHNE